MQLQHTVKCFPTAAGVNILRLAYLDVPSCGQQMVHSALNEITRFGTNNNKGSGLLPDMEGEHGDIR